MSTYKFFTYPITLHSRAFANLKGTMDDIMNFALYKNVERFSGDLDERLNSAAEYMAITFGDLWQAYDKGEFISQKTPPKTPKTSVSKDIVFDYYKNEKTEFDIACFLAFAGIRSIIQKKPFIKTNKQFIHARMYGFSSPKEMAEMTPIEAKYNTRRRMDRIIKELQDNWYLKAFANHCRGIYLGFEKVTLKDLAFECENRKMKNRDKRRKAEKDKVLNEVLAENVQLKKEKTTKCTGSVHLNKGNVQQGGIKTTLRRHEGVHLKEDTLVRYFSKVV